MRASGLPAVGRVARGDAVPGDVCQVAAMQPDVGKHVIIERKQDGKVAAIPAESLYVSRWLDGCQRLVNSPV